MRLVVFLVLLVEWVVKKNCPNLLQHVELLVEESCRRPRTLNQVFILYVY